MKRFLLLLLVIPVFAAMFLLWPQFTRPVFASDYKSSTSCPYPTYTGCSRTISNEPGWNQGYVIGGGSLIVGNNIMSDVANNTLIVTGGSNIQDNVGNWADLFGGATHDTHAARDNRVYLFSGSQAGNIYGGVSEKGRASSNEVWVNGAGTIVNVNAVGGWSKDTDTPEASGNIVRLSNSTQVTGDAIGGYTSNIPVTSVRASSNQVLMDSKVSVGGSVYGAKIEDGGDNGAADNNTVIIRDSTVTTDVYGAFIANLQGGDARGNRVTVSDGSSIGQDVFGALAQNEVSGNSATVLASTVSRNVIGGRSRNDKAVNNSAHAEGATVVGDIIGGLSDNGAAIGNSAIMVGGSAANLYGGSSVSAATGNSVTLYAGTVSSDVIGGHSAIAAASTINNTVTLYDGTIGGQLLGGSDAGDYRGNTLNLRGQAMAGEANHFQNYNVLIPANMSAGSIMLQITGATPTNLALSDVTSFSIDPAGTVHYKSGDEITLISDTTGGSIDKSYPNLARGVSSLYDVRVLMKGKALVAVIDGQQSNPQAATLAGPVLTGLTLLNLGADLVAGNALDQAWKSTRNSAEGGSWSYFSNFTYEDMTINDNIDVKGWSYLMGLAWRDGNDSDYGFLGGGFFETGYADYDGSQNYAGVGRARYDGNVRYYGFGGLARYKLPSRLRLEASLRFGKMDSDYGAREYAGGQKPHYSMNTIYSGAHAGAGWDMNLTEGVNMDLSAKYFWVRQFGETVSVGDERLKFKDSDSHRLKAGSRLTLMPHKRFDLYAGAYGEYEMGGDVDARNLTAGSGNLNAMDLDDGASGVFELGVSVLPDEEGLRYLVLDFMLSASVGRREGFGGHFSLGWNF
ncbi:hypothetical protein LJC15_04305 [Desulfovibrio sp. OttesenSCG-928-G11]|nr:hypothetical protein [Desulfovibrio sp. OttesenSCG-928-G11]